MNLFAASFVDEMLRACQDEIAALCENPYYVRAYRQAERSYWQHIPSWISVDIAERRPRACLDIGCAYGTLLLYVNWLSGCDTYGLDFVDAYMSPQLVAKYSLHFTVNNIEFDPFPWKR